MATEIGDAIRSMVAEKNISEELVISTIEDILRAAYKRKFGTDENASLSSVKIIPMLNSQADARLSMMTNGIMR